MKERISNGRFAPKEDTPKRRPGFQKGRAKTGGRQKGTPNKVSRDVKEWITSMAGDAEVQDAIRERILAGDAVAFLRIVEQAIGKPTERQQVTVEGKVDHRLEVYWNGRRM